MKSVTLFYMPRSSKDLLAIICNYLYEHSFLVNLITDINYFYSIYGTYLDADYQDLLSACFAHAVRLLDSIEISRVAMMYWVRRGLLRIQQQELQLSPAQKIKHNVQNIVAELRENKILIYKNVSLILGMTSLLYILPELNVLDVIRWSYCKLF